MELPDQVRSPSLCCWAASWLPAAVAMMMRSACLSAVMSWGWLRGRGRGVGRPQEGGPESQVRIFRLARRANKEYSVHLNRAATRQGCSEVWNKFSGGTGPKRLDEVSITCTLQVWLCPLPPPSQPSPAHSRAWSTPTSHLIIAWTSAEHQKMNRVAS